MMLNWCRNDFYLLICFQFFWLKGASGCSFARSISENLSSSVTSVFLHNFIFLFPIVMFGHKVETLSHVEILILVLYVIDILTTVWIIFIILFNLVLKLLTHICFINKRRPVSCAGWTRNLFTENPCGHLARFHSRIWFSSACGIHF